MARVLVIEPAPAERDRLALCLRRAGCTVRSAGDAAGALEHVHEWHPEIVIVSLQMQGTGGRSMVTTLRSGLSPVPFSVIAMLAPGDRDIRTALLAGADDALVAPVSEPALLESIEARAKRAATTPPPTDASDHLMEGLTTALSKCTRPATVALVALQDANAIASIEGPAAMRQFETAWRQRVQALAIEAVSVTAIGPCECMVVLPPRTSQVRALLASIAGTGQLPIAVGTAAYRARAAIGTLTLLPDEPLPPTSTVVRRCRFALERARQLEYPQVHAFSEAEARGVLDDLELATLIQQAAENGRFQLVYLPKVSLPTGAVTGVEALIRWNMPSGESIPPSRLLAVADAAGLLDEVGTWALREACRQAALWTQEGIRLNMSVNIAGGQFRRGDFVDETRMALSESGLQGEQLMVEVSERALARDGGSMRDQLADVRVAGVRISVEDVGAGALSLPTLRSMALDEIKLDQSLVAPLPGNGQDRAAVDMVLREARELHVPCVAEGVEHPAQLAYLAERGWDSAQGWLISHPLPPEAVPAFCAQAERAAASATR